ncbi:MAG: fluoride efflux transporter CrcB [SAR324 cluster bacterium]|nr:fluoride efflux transporter CrcB [SAR324 cluster bacterium]
MTTLFAIGTGGFVGAILRYLLSKQVQQLFAGNFPYGTLTVNGIGSFTLGFLSYYLLENMMLNDDLRIGLTVGCLGAFTTFSTFSYETLTFLQAGDYVKMSINVLSNVLICIILCAAGLQLAKHL